MAHVLLTGISGFVARRTARALLDAGHRVRGSVRSEGAAQAVRALFAGAGDRLELVRLDLGNDAGWREAATGVDAVVHTASPFPLATDPADPDVLVRPAVDGTRRALEAARDAGVARVVLTSSVAAVIHGPRPEGRPRDERDWTDPAHPAANAYVRSKLEAERLAWSLAGVHGLALTVLNPAFVLGPPMAEERGASLQLIERLLGGKDPMVPPIKLDVVDVRDVAAAHLAALEDPASAGERFVLSADALWIADIARIAREEAPGRRIPTRTAPAVLVKGLALFDPVLRDAVPVLGRDEPLSGDKAHRVLGLDYRAPEEAVRAAVRALM
ncbi:NAD-dependent epimerase/dehydratase family protein [Jannaschia sp. W003]|uniref:NAD-dependent epimerase/dehydratase family protein n=1 Tax=Jannaschia sp. W003 TaxID=2867012 RepID=UPI0021A537F5|nr:NAD-dependent epimerase/dehydratase family protein [Jannaschia sp. W003]UWQ21273.1 NAD-dependent epimerase/dehydratase family protein [Jannaschia sp. W003]